MSISNNIKQLTPGSPPVEGIADGISGVWAPVLGWVAIVGGALGPMAWRGLPWQGCPWVAPLGVVMCPGSAGLDRGGKGKIPEVTLVGWAVAAHSRAWLGCGGKSEMPEEGTVLRMVRPIPMGFSPVF